MLVKTVNTVADTTCCYVCVSDATCVEFVPVISEIKQLWHEFIFYTCVLIPGIYFLHRYLWTLALCIPLQQNFDTPKSEETVSLKFERKCQFRLENSFYD